MENVKDQSGVQVTDNDYIDYGNKKYITPSNKLEIEHEGSEDECTTPIMKPVKPIKVGNYSHFRNRNNSSLG